MKMWTLIKPIKLRIAAIFCILLLLLGLLSYFAMPSFVVYMVKKALVLSSPSAQTYSAWQKTPIPLYTKIYFFNITNAEDVLALRARPKVEELGPYVFREEREKVDIGWTHANGTVSYKQIRRYFFEPSMTKGSLEDVITHINVPMVSSVVQLDEAARKYVNPELADKLLYPNTNKVIEEKGNILFPSHRVRELLFEGYDDGMIFKAPAYNLEVVIKYKFGWFAGKNDTAPDGVYRIFTGESGIEKLGFIDTWNGNRKLTHWNSPACNYLGDTTPGDFRPPYQIPVPDTIRIFVGDICRAIPLTLKEPVELRGVKANRYWAGPDTFDYSANSENLCYCDMHHGVTTCPPNGIMSLSKCHPGAATVSFPHFLYAEPRIRDLIDGLNPDCHNHMFFMDVEPTLGVAIRVAARIQINVLFKRDSRLNFASNLTEPAIYFPAMWSESTAEIGDDLVSQLLFLQAKLPVILSVVAWIEIIVGLLGLIAIFVYVRKYDKRGDRLKPVNCLDTKPGTSASSSPPSTSAPVQYEPVKANDDEQ